MRFTKEELITQKQILELENKKLKDSINNPQNQPDVNVNKKLNFFNIIKNFFNSFIFNLNLIWRIYNLIGHTFVYLWGASWANIIKKFAIVIGLIQILIGSFTIMLSSIGLSDLTEPINLYQIFFSNPDLFIQFKDKILNWLIDLFKGWISEDIDKVNESIEQINNMLESQVSDENSSKSKKDLYITIACGIVAILCLSLAYYNRDAIFDFFKKDNSDPSTGTGTDSRDAPSTKVDTNKTLSSSSTDTTNNILPKTNFLDSDYYKQLENRLWWCKKTQWINGDLSRKYLLELYENLNLMINHDYGGNMTLEQIKDTEKLMNYITYSELELYGKESFTNTWNYRQMNKIIKKSLENINLESNKPLLTSDLDKLIISDSDLLSSQSNVSSANSSPRSDITVKPIKHDTLESTITPLPLTYNTKLNIQTLLWYKNLFNKNIKINKLNKFLSDKENITMETVANWLSNHPHDENYLNLASFNHAKDLFIKFYITNSKPSESILTKKIFDLISNKLNLDTAAKFITLTKKFLTEFNKNI